MNSNKLNLTLFFINLFVFLGSAIFLIFVIRDINDPQEKLKLWAKALMFLAASSLSISLYFLSKQNKIK